VGKWEILEKRKKSTREKTSMQKKIRQSLLREIRGGRVHSAEKNTLRRSGPVRTMAEKEGGGSAREEGSSGRTAVFL